MNETTPRSPLLREIGIYLMGLVLTALLLVPFLRLHRVDWRYPIALTEKGDGTYYAMQVKILIETGWVFHHPDLGAPFGLYLYDFAHFDALHLLLMKGLALFTSDWAVVMNLYFLLGFPLTTVTSLVLFRSLRWNPWLCLFLALAFTFQPYHLHRGQGHIMLAGYYLLPLQFLSVLWLLTPQGLSDSSGQRFWTAPRFLVCITITFVAVFAGHYYTAFAWMAFTIATVHRAVVYRCWRDLSYPAILLVVILCGSTLNMLPNLLFWSSHGLNREVSAKLPGMVEQYGLKLTPILLPSQDHLLTAFGKIRETYEHFTPLRHGPSSSIGIAAALGLVVAMGFGFLSRERQRLLTGIGVVSLGLVLFCTLAGFGSLFAHLITPQLHGLGRVAIVLALLGLISFGALLSHLQESGWLGRLYPAGLGLLGVLMLLDLYPARPAYDPHILKTQFRSHRAFAESLAERMPKGSLIHQMPVTSFPFNGYHRSIPYLYTDGYRWTFPSMLHRRGIAWCEALEHLPPEKMLEEMARAGVDGLLLDTRCREDTGWLREPPLPVAWRRTEDLHCYLLAQGLKPSVSKEDQLFFDLREILQPYRERLRHEATGSGPTEIQPTTLRYVTQWAYVRPTHLEGWTRNRQCLEGAGSLELVNHTSEPIEVCFRFVLEQQPGTASQCEVKSRVLKADPWVVGVGKQEARFLLPPGRHPVHFQSLVNDRKAPLRFVLDQIALDVIDPAATVVGR